MPDPAEDGKHIDPTKCDTSFYPKSVCQCEVHEACAVHVSGCQNGCSSAELDTLASFLGCYVKGNPSDEDNCGPQHLHPCIKSSGLDSTAMTTCIKNPKAYNPVVVEAYQKSEKIQTYPYAVVNGKIQPQGIDATELAKPHILAHIWKCCRRGRGAYSSARVSLQPTACTWTRAWCTGRRIGRRWRGALLSVGARRRRACGKEQRRVRRDRRHR